MGALSEITSIKSKIVIETTHWAYLWWLYTRVFEFHFFFHLKKIINPNLFILTCLDIGSIYFPNQNIEKFLKKYGNCWKNALKKNSTENARVFLHIDLCFHHYVFMRKNNYSILKNYFEEWKKNNRTKFKQNK